MAMSLRMWISRRESMSITKLVMAHREYKMHRDPGDATITLGERKGQLSSVERSERCALLFTSFIMT